ncbi:MAG: hypothetical protein WAM97_12440 [Acidimicrobiales bacterium]
MPTVRRSTFVGFAAAMVMFAPLWNPGVAAAASSAQGSDFSLAAVSCAQPSSCMAVGDYVESSGAIVPLSERFNGATWSSMSIRGPRFSGLSAVWCSRAFRCMAVGYSRYAPFSETWNGTAWSQVSVPAPAGQTDSDLLSLSCTSLTSCSAVGYYLNQASTWLTLAARWNGSSWSLTDTPNPAGVTGSELEGVGCTTSSDCVAVGYSFNSKGNSHTLIERWNGSRWGIVASPNGANGSEDVLNAVSCVTGTDCTAVGDYFGLSARTIPLIEDWNGHVWTDSAVAGVSGQFEGISCTKQSTCMAVGGASDGTFTEARTHGAWKRVTSPNPKYGGKSAILSGISCRTFSSCAAVGSYTGVSSDTTYNLGEIWNGAEWKLTPTPNL